MSSVERSLEGPQPVSHETQPDCHGRPTVRNVQTGVVVDTLKPYYDRDGITIYHARCEDILPSIDPATVDLLLTDPPYGINLSTDWSGWNGGGKSYAPVMGDDAPFDPSHLLTYPKVCLWGANHFADKLPVGRWLFWRKVDASPLMAAGELAWHNCGGRPVDYYETTINQARNRDGALHPTQKPVSLMMWQLERFGVKPGDLVLDPYMGSGPLAQACYELGILYIGIEVVEGYCAAAVSRLRQQTLDLSGAPARKAEPA